MDKGTITVCNALKDSKISKLQELVLRSNDITVSGAESVAAYLAVSASLTKISLAQNNLAEEGTKVICDVVKGNTTLKELNLAGGFTSGTNIGGPAGAKHVADMLGVNASLTKVECACPQNEPTWPFIVSFHHMFAPPPQMPQLPATCILGR